MNAARVASPRDRRQAETMTEPARSASWHWWWDLVPLLALPLAVAVGYAIYETSVTDVQPIFRYGIHFYASLFLYGPHWMQAYYRERRPRSGVHWVLGGSTLRVFALIALLLWLFATQRPVAAGVVLYVVTIGTFLCFQVVMETLRPYHGRA